MSDENVDTPSGADAGVDSTDLLGSSDDCWEFCDKHLGFDTWKAPTCELKSVDLERGQSMLYDWLESDEKSLYLGSDGNYYTREERTEPYGDYATTTFDWYQRFDNPETVKSLLA